MASQKITLHPISDISIESHRCKTHRDEYIPDGGVAVYPLVNEIVADDDATYVRLYSGEGAHAYCNCIFGLDTNGISNNVQVTSVNMYLRGKHSSTVEFSAGCLSLIIDNIEYYYSDYREASPTFGLTTTEVVDGSNVSVYGTKVKSLSDDGIISINNYIRTHKHFPSLQYVVDISLGDSGTQSKSHNFYFTQCYIEIEYEEVTDIGVHHKVNGEWKTATAAYRKVNGAWTEITEDECKSLLSSSLCGK